METAPEDLSGRAQRMPMPTRATPQERLRTLPDVPKFGPGFPGYTPPLVGAVAAAVRPMPKARLLSYKSVLELRAKAAAAAQRRGAIEGRPRSLPPPPQRGEGWVPVTPRPGSARGARGVP
eukprot:15481502-Alexandrium_andersonii.AAC.1